MWWYTYIFAVQYVVLWGFFSPKTMTESGSECSSQEDLPTGGGQEINVTSYLPIN